jgi:hypothetical protein
MQYLKDVNFLLTIQQSHLHHNKNPIKYFLWGNQKVDSERHLEEI